MTKVLVADDSGTMRAIIVRSLNSLGVSDVVQAEDGTKAVELFQPGVFDLVLTDWNMPGKTGLEVIQDIRLKDANVPVIMITTESDKARVVQAIQAGVTDFVVKPFDSKVLREKLAKYNCQEVS